MNKLAVGWVVLQVLLLAGWAWREEGRQVEGTTILVQPEPIDPRDLLRGQYLDLRYSFSSTRNLRGLAEGAELPEPGQTVWVRLAEEGGFHVPVGASAGRPNDLAEGEVGLRGSVQEFTCTFGIERFYVPEGSDTPSPEDTIVKLRVGPDGRARIEQLIVNGSPWP